MRDQWAARWYGDRIAEEHQAIHLVSGVLITSATTEAEWFGRNWLQAIGVVQCEHGRMPSVWFEPAGGGRRCGRSASSRTNASHDSVDHRFRAFYRNRTKPWPKGKKQKNK